MQCPTLATSCMKMSVCIGTHVHIHRKEIEEAKGSSTVSKHYTNWVAGTELCLRFVLQSLMA